MYIGEMLSHSGNVLILKAVSSRRLLIALILCLSIPAAHACTSPTGVAGTMGYDVTGGGNYEYCDGTSWIVMKGTDTASGNLAAHWKLDESSGTTAADDVGSLDGTLVNTPTWQPSSGIIDGDLSFDAVSNQMVLIPRSAAIEPAAITVSLWMIRNGAQKDYAALIDKSYNNNAIPVYASYNLQFNGASDQQLDFATGYSGGYHSLLTTSTVIPDNTWVHVVGTYDPLAPAPQKKIYIDGALNASATESNAILYDTNATTGRLRLGRTTSTSFNQYNGELDDVRIYDRALSAAEVTALYGLTSCSKLGELDYNTTSKLYQWCGAGNVLSNVSATVGSGSGGCAASGALLAGAEGAMQYDTANDKMVFCGGSSWVNMPN